MATLNGPFVVLETTTVSGGGGGGGPPPVVMLPPPHATAKAKVADTTAPRRIFMPRDSTPTIVALCCPCALCDPCGEALSPLTDNHLAQDFLHNLRRHRRRNAAEILHWVVLHHVRPHDLSLDRVQMRDRFPYRHPSWLPMRYSRGKRRIEDVDIERDVN